MSDAKKADEWTPKQPMVSIKDMIRALYKVGKRCLVA